MASLLDFLMQRNPLAAGLLGRGERSPDDPINPLLGRAVQTSGLIGSNPVPAVAPTPATPPVPGPAPGAFQPSGPAPQSFGPGGPNDGKAQAQRQRLGNVLQFTQSTLGRDLPDETVRDIQAAETGDTGPGQPGQDFMTKLFVGFVPKGLTKEEVRQLRQSAMLTAGLQILGSDRTGIEAVANGIAIARQVATASAGELLDEKARQASAARYRSALTDANYDTELERYNEARRRALADGDLEAVKVLNDVIKELRDLPADADQRVFRIVGGNAFWVNEAEGKAYDLAGREITPELMRQNAQESGRTITRSVRGADGLMHDVLFDAATGQRIRDLGISEKAPAIKPASSEGVTVASTIEREVGVMEDILSERGFRPFNRVESKLLNEAQSAEQQQFRAAANNVLSLIVRARSGAQATEAEVRRLESFAVPLPGDDPETVRQKLQRLRDAVAELRGGSTPSASVDLDAADRILNEAAGGN